MSPAKDHATRAWWTFWVLLDLLDHNGLDGTQWICRLSEQRIMTVKNAKGKGMLPLSGRGD